MGTSSDAVGNGVGGAVAQPDGACDPGHAGVGLVRVGVGGVRLVAGRIGAAGHEVASDSPGVGVAHDHAVLAWGDEVGESLRVRRGPTVRVVDTHADLQDVLLNCVVRAGSDCDRVGDRVTLSDCDSGLATGGTDDGRHGDVPVGELGVGQDLHLAALVAAALEVGLLSADLGAGRNGVPGQGTTLLVHSALAGLLLNAALDIGPLPVLHHVVATIGTGQDDIIMEEESGLLLGRGRSGEANQGEHRG